MLEAREALLDALTAAYRKADAGRLRERIEALVREARNKGLSEREIEEQLQSWRIQLFRRQGEWISAEAALADLQRLLAGPQSWWGKIWSWLRRIAGFAVNHYVPVAGTMVAIGSALYGLAYAQFYDSLDITPEQAGLTPAQILAHSVIGGLVLVALITFALFCLLIPLIPIKEKAALAEPGNWADVITNAILTLAGIGALLKLGSLADIPFSVILPYPIVIMLFLFFASLSVTHRGWRPVVRLASLDMSIERYLVVMIVCTFPALFFTGWFTFLEAKELGEKVSVGKAVRDPKIGIFPFLGVRAEPALLTWTGRDRVPQVPSCVLYLGSSEGKLIVYDHRSSSTFRIPDDEAALQLQSQMSSCDAPRPLRTPSVLPFKSGRLRCTHGKWHSSAKPDFSYEWIAEGYQVDYNRGPDWLLYESGFPPETVVYCRVKATTPLGDNTAISAPAILTHEPPVKREKYSPTPTAGHSAAP